VNDFIKVGKGHYHSTKYGIVTELSKKLQSGEKDNKVYTVGYTVALTDGNSTRLSTKFCSKLTVIMHAKIHKLLTTKGGKIKTLTNQLKNAREMKNKTVKELSKAMDNMRKRIKFQDNELAATRACVKELARRNQQHNRANRANRKGSTSASTSRRNSERRLAETPRTPFEKLCEDVLEAQDE